MRIILIFLIFVLFSGCIAADKTPASTHPATPSPTPDLSMPIAALPPTPTVQKPGGSMDENYSIAQEVDYRKYVDWFMAYNVNIRGYTQEEYVCGQYTDDMIKASKKAGFNAYFAAVKFSDGTGHALVAFKSTSFNYTSWYFFEPQTNNQMTPQTIVNVLNERMGKAVTEITVYGYYDDAKDKDPTTWRFAYPLYNIKY